MVSDILQIMLSYLLQLYIENKQVVALQRELQEKNTIVIDSGCPDVQECQETKLYKDKEVQVNYLVHLTGQYKLLKNVFERYVITLPGGWYLIYCN